MSLEIKQAKIKLYWLLLEMLEKDSDSLTENELNLGVLLAFDKDIQEVLETARIKADL